MLENSINMNLPIALGTNLNQKTLQVIAVQNADPCSSYLGRSSMLSTSETVVINGISFLKETGGDGAAGQIHQWVAYSTLRDHTCVTFDMILHITNPGNYLTPPPAFNETAEIAVLTNMVSTFTWLGATPTPTFTPTPFGYDWPTYVNSKYGFQIQYPQSAALTIQNDNAAHLTLPFANGTNLKEKILDILIREDLQTCRSLIASSSMLVTSETVTINNTSFLKEVGEDGAAGNLYQWVAAGEHHTVEQALAAAQKGQHRVPVHGGGRCGVQQFGVVAIAAAPGAALAKHHRRQVARKVHTGQRREAADTQVGGEG